MLFGSLSDALRRCTLCMLTLGYAVVATANEPILRLPVVAGKYYSVDPGALQREVAHWVEAAHPLPSNGKLRAIIAPHSPYPLAGATLGEAFAPLQPGEFDRVIVLAPAHTSRFEGCSIPQADAFVTPLGVIPIDWQAVESLNLSTLVTVKQIRYDSRAHGERVHETESSIEVVLPFLQARLGQFTLVPILVGSFLDATGKYSQPAIDAVADRIRPLLNDRTLLVVSTDFTHYGNHYRFTPFSNDIDAGIRNLDRGAFEALVNLDSAALNTYFVRSENTICGKTALQLLIAVLPDRALGTLVAHHLSAEVNQDYNQCISFAAMHFYDYGRRVRTVAPQPEAEAPKKSNKPTMLMTNKAGTAGIAGPGTANGPVRMLSEGNAAQATAEPLPPRPQVLNNDAVAAAAALHSQAVEDAARVAPLPEKAPPVVVEPPVETVSTGAVMVVPPAVAGGAPTLTNRAPQPPDAADVP